MPVKTWTEEEEQRLRDCADKCIDDILPLFPDKNRECVRGKLEREGLYDASRHSARKPPTKVGDVYGRWTVLQLEMRRIKKQNGTFALVRCSCEEKTEKWVDVSCLRKGTSQSCGCLHSERVSDSLTARCAARDWGNIGDTHGRLTIIGEKTMREDAAGVRKTYVLCACSCGSGIEKEYNLSRIVSGETKSCGCLAREVPATYNSTHKESRTKLYRRWCSMIRRCYNESVEKYPDYGGRGIKVCDEWHTYEVFAAWAKSNGYDESLELDRVDNDGNYEAANCRWTDRTGQNNNKRNNVLLEYQGKTQNVTQWAKELGVPSGLLFNRINLGWTVEDTLGTPFRQIARLKIISFRGKEQSLLAWAEELGIKVTILRGRLKRLKWSVERAFTTPMRGSKVLDADQ